MKTKNRKAAEFVANSALRGDTKPLELLASKAVKLGVPFIAPDGTEIRTKDEMVKNILKMLGV